MALIVIYKYLSKRNNKTNCRERDFDPITQPRLPPFEHRIEHEYTVIINK